MLQTQAEKQIETALTIPYGYMTHQQMGEILCLADETGAWDEAVKWIGGIKTGAEAEAYKEELINRIIMQCDFEGAK